MSLSTAKKLATRGPEKSKPRKRASVSKDSIKKQPTYGKGDDTRRGA